ncbi:hypothetical protein R6Q59_028962 [Mikania micrantha]
MAAENAQKMAKKPRENKETTRDDSALVEKMGICSMMTRVRNDDGCQDISLAELTDIPTIAQLGHRSCKSVTVGLAGHDYFLTRLRQFVDKSNINTKLEVLPQSSCYLLLLQPVLTLTPESRPQETSPVVRLTVHFVGILAGPGHQPGLEDGYGNR